MGVMWASVMLVFMANSEPVDMVTGIYDSKEECIAAMKEQKIPGNCYPVDKVIHMNNNEIPAGLKTAP
ncbi:TPA: DUF1482 family protein [Escherichia coli]|nr:DUF1482 family protein [Escherichia coli]